MENSKQDLDRLIDKYLSGEATSDERNLLEQSYMKASMKTSTSDVSGADADRINKIGKDSWEILIDKINQIGAKRVAVWSRIAVAASIALAVTIGGYFYYNNQHSKIQQRSTYAAEIVPGKLGATLTLSNGKKIRLSDAAKGQLAHEAGVSISKTADGQVIYEVKASLDGAAENNLGAINTLTTAKGETYILTLPDKSKVWLNAASSLTYASVLNERGQRRVKLSGEAYFQIAKDKAHPFIVETDQQEVEVLGTHFNINVYPDEDAAKTSLLEGLVKVSKNGKSALLKPGQESIILSGKSVISVRNADVQAAVAWKNGLFSFKRAELKVVMRQIARWYDVEIVYQGDIPETAITGTIGRNLNASQALQIISNLGISFKIEGKKIIINGK